MLYADKKEDIHSCRGFRQAAGLYIEYDSGAEERLYEADSEVSDLEDDASYYPGKTRRVPRPGAPDGPPIKVRELPCRPPTAEVSTRRARA